MMTRMTCLGPVLGVYNKEQAKAAGNPGLEGKQMRGVKLRKRIDRKTKKTIESAVPCGNDLTALIAAVPEDANDHLVKCPRCGNVSIVCRVPKDQVEGEPAAATD